jgi:hypothetical protein
MRILSEPTNPIRIPMAGNAINDSSRLTWSRPSVNYRWTTTCSLACAFRFKARIEFPLFINFSFTFLINFSNIEFEECYNLFKRRWSETPSNLPTKSLIFKVKLTKLCHHACMIKYQKRYCLWKQCFEIHISNKWHALRISNMAAAHSSYRVVMHGTIVTDGYRS